MGWDEPTLKDCCLGVLHLNPCRKVVGPFSPASLQGERLTKYHLLLMWHVFYVTLFELGMGEGKESGRDICESYFSTTLSPFLIIICSFLFS